MSVTVRPVTDSVGAEILGVDLRTFSEEEFAAIERAWYAHSMILLRGQQLSDDHLLAFSRRFGELDPPPNQERGRISPPGYPDIYVVSNVLDTKGDPIGALGDGEAVWHTDMSYLDVPPDASMLYSLEIPPTGGNTWFTSMQAACDALPASLRAKIEGRRVKHDGTYNSGGYLRKGVTADRRSDGRARRLASGDPAPPGQRPRHALSRASSQFLCRGLYAGRIRRGAGRTVGARHAAALHLPACLEAGRPRDVGQSLDHASPRSVRQSGASHHASHADQGTTKPIAFAA